MSACPYRRFAIDYAEDRLDPVRRAEYEQHLTACPGCRAEQKELAALFAVLARDAIPQPDPEFWTGVLQSARRDSRPLDRRSRRRWLRFAPAFVPLMAAAVWLIVVLSRQVHTVDLTIPLENIVRWEDFDLLPLDALVDDSLYERITSLESYCEPGIDDAIGELDDDQLKTLIESIEARFGG